MYENHKLIEKLFQGTFIHIKIKQKNFSFDRETDAII